MRDSTGTGVALGLTAAGLGALLNMFLLPLVSGGRVSTLTPLLFFGVGQFLYVLPLAVVLDRRRRFDTAKGLWITAGTLFSLNALCTGAVMLSF